MLSLRLRGAGFHPEDAVALVRLWESGRPMEQLIEAAVDLGYEPGPNLEAALSGVRRRFTGD